MDWLLGLITTASIIGGAFVFAWSANPFRKEIDTRRAMLKACSWNGSGNDVHCGMCGDKLTEKNIASMDEDGNGYCYLHTRKGCKP